MTCAWFDFLFSLKCVCFRAWFCYRFTITSSKKAKYITPLSQTSPQSISSHTFLVIKYDIYLPSTNILMIYVTHNMEYEKHLLFKTNDNLIPNILMYNMFHKPM